MLLKNTAKSSYRIENSYSRSHVGTPLPLQPQSMIHATIAAMNPNTKAATIAPTTLATFMLTVFDAACITEYDIIHCTRSGNYTHVLCSIQKLTLTTAGDGHILTVMAYGEKRGDPCH